MIETGSYFDGAVAVTWTRLFCDRCGRNLSFEDRGEFRTEYVGCPCGRVFWRLSPERLAEIEQKSRTDS